VHVTLSGTYLKLSAPLNCRDSMVVIHMWSSSREFWWY